MQLLEWEQMSFYDRLAIKERSERSFLNFTRIWFELLQGQRLMVNWHHKLITRKIDDIIRNGNRCNLCICLPPGGTKTEIMSIHLPAYTNMLVQIGELDKFRNLNLSFADSLTKRNSRRTRDIIASAEYQELWPCKFGVNQAEEWQVVDDKGKVKGETVSRSMGGQITGGRGGYPGPKFSGAVNLDDPSKPEHMFSKIKREAEHRILVNTVRSRRGDKSKEHPTPFFIIQQRLHKEDVVGFCMSGGLGVEFEIIEIPALITREYIDSLPGDIRQDCLKCIDGTDSRTVGGVEYWSFWPQMEHIDQLIALWERDEYTFLSQYMQKPVEITGGLADSAWLPTYTELPFLDWMAIYVDTNSGKVKDHNDYTVFSLCGMGCDGNMYLLEVVRGKWRPDELLSMAEDLWARWSSCAPAEQRLVLRYMSVEDKQAGQGLISQLQRDNSIPVRDVQRGEQQNKLIRFNNCQPLMKMGKVRIPALHADDGERITHTTWLNGQPAFATDWVLPFVTEFNNLTVGVLMDQEKGYDDQVDTLLDAIDDMLLTQQGGLVDLMF